MVQSAKSQWDFWLRGHPANIDAAECKFNVDAANVVHMTVRPQDIVDEEDASKGKTMGRERGEGESTAGCRCVIL